MGEEGRGGGEREEMKCDQSGRRNDCTGTWGVCVCAHVCVAQMDTERRDNGMLSEWQTEMAPIVN